MKIKNIKSWLLIANILIICSCTKTTPMKPDFDAALQKHFDSIANRDLDAFKSHLTKNKKLYTIVQNGYAFTTPEESVAIHKEWFKDHNWIWEGAVVHKVVGDDMAMVLVKYKYRTSAKDSPVETWLTYVFKLEDGEWKIIHDQNTALNFHAFEKMMSKGKEKN